MKQPQTAIIRCVVSAVVLVAFPALPARTEAGGGPENALLIIDPSVPESMYVGNYYKHARNIPERNIIYMSPRASSYGEHTEFQLDALFGMLTQLLIDDHIDYIIVPPCSEFYVPASGYVSDTCSPVNRFSLSSVYTMAFLVEDIIDGPDSSEHNHYSTPGSMNARAFDANTHWFNGQPIASSAFPRYFIGALLGYDGERGNTIEETIAMIDRSVSVDGTLPAGTFYFMETTDSARSAPRHGFFDGVVSVIVGLLGGQAEHLYDVLPVGHHDCLGIMTGWAAPDIEGADMTILPGAFCDHLTSYAGRFDTSDQTKLSRWIAKGASGSHGAVEEPCNYPGKFPRAGMHALYLQGLSLGEAVFRSLEYVPFQTLLYGDPLTRPFAHLPVTTVPDAPTGEVSGVVVLSPEATTSHPTAGIDGFELYIDGILSDSAEFGGQFSIDTLELADGAHDVRVVAYDDTLVASQGRWTATMSVNNHGRSVELSVDPPSGDLSTAFTFDVSASGGPIARIRLECNGRVVAADNVAPTGWVLLGRDLGGGPSGVRAIAEFTDGRRAFGDVVVVDVAFDNAPPPDPGLEAPVAFSYTRDVPFNEPLLVELPATDADGSALTFTLHDLPDQADVEGSGLTRLLRPDPDAVGCDTLTFTVSDGESESELASVALRYAGLRGDFDYDGDVDLVDHASFQACFTGFEPDGPPSAACAASFDYHCNGTVDLSDYASFAIDFNGPQ